ncbi:MAG: phage holin family protein [Chitinophagaceae bacterium]
MTYKEELFDKISDVAVHTREYVENRVELEVLKGADKISQGLAAAIVLLAAMGFGFIVLLLLLFGAAAALNDYLNSAYLGYLITAAVAAIIGIAIITIGKSVLKNVFMNTIINNIEND